MKTAETTITTSRLFSPFLVPFQRNAAFLGRLDELNQIHINLQSKKTAGIQPAQGSGEHGIGKTQLAIEYAFRYQSHYSDGVFWIDAAQSITHGLSKLIQQIWHGQVTRAVHLGPNQLLAIRRLLYIHFDEDEIRQLAYELKLKAGALAEDKHNRVISLVDFCRQHNRIPELVSAIQFQRPQFGQENTHLTVREAGLPYLPHEMVEFAFQHLGQLNNALLIIDNLVEPTKLKHPLSQDLTLESLPCAILFTTPEWTPQNFPMTRLPTLPPNMALRLLLRDKARQPIFVPSHPENAPARDVCTMLGWLPLSLKIAGAYLSSYPHVSLNNLALRFKTEHTLVHLDTDLNKTAASQLAQMQTAGLTVMMQTQWAALKDPLAKQIAHIACQFPRNTPLPSERLGLLAGLTQENPKIETNGASSLLSLTFTSQQPLFEEEEEEIRPPWQTAVNTLIQLGFFEPLQLNEVQLPSLIHQFLNDQLTHQQHQIQRQQAAHHLTTAYEDLTILETNSRQRGIEDVKLDLIATHALIQNQDEALAQRLQQLLNFMQTESDNLQRWQLKMSRAFFIQQAYNYAALNKITTLNTFAKQWFKENYQPYLTMQWAIRWTSEILDKTLTGHEATVRALALTPDGQKVVSASSDHTLRVWNLAMGREELILQGHEKTVQAVAITPNGRFAVSASSDHTIRIWDITTGQQIHLLRGHKDWVRAIAITPDGKTIISGSDDCTIKLWEFDTGKQIRTLTGHEAWVRSVTLTPDGQQILSTSSDRTLKLWQRESGELKKTFTGHDSMVLAAHITPDGKHAISASADNTLKLWDLQKGKVERTYNGHTDWVGGVAITNDGQSIISASADNTLKLWRINPNGKKVKPILKTFTGHKAMVRSVVVTADNHHAISGSTDSTLKIWNLNNHSHDNDIGHKKAVRAVTIMPNGRYAVSASSDHTLKIWHLATGKEEQTLSGHAAAVSDVAVSPNGRYAVSASSDHTLKIWDLVKGKAIYTLRGHDDVVLAVTITPDGQKAVSTSADRSIMVWDIATGKELGVLQGHSDWVRDVAVTPNTQYAISVSDDLRIKQWNLSTGKVERIFTGHEDWIRNILVMPNGRFILSASDDRTIKMWDLTTGYEQYNLVGHEDAVRAIALTADGQRLVSGAADRTIKVWDLTTGQELAAIAIQGELYCLDVSADGNVIVAGDRLGHVYCLTYTDPT